MCPQRGGTFHRGPRRHGGTVGSGRRRLTFACEVVQRAGRTGLLGAPRSRNVILPAEVTLPSAGGVYRQRRARLIGITSAAEDRDARFLQ